LVKLRGGGERKGIQFPLEKIFNLCVPFRKVAKNV